jgi:hypothetical protein
MVTKLKAIPANKACQRVESKRAAESVMVCEVAGLFSGSHHRGFWINIKYFKI